MTLSPENRAALAADQRESMMRAGIPEKFLDLRLGDLGASGTEIAEWLHQYGLDMIRKRGKTLILEGPVVATNEMLYVMGRGLMKAGFGIRIVRPLELAMILEDRDPEEHERLWRLPILMMNPFQGSDDSPFPSSYVRYRVQEFLLDRINHTKSHVLIRRQATKPWWTPDFLELLTEDAKTFKVKA